MRIVTWQRFLYPDFAELKGIEVTIEECASKEEMPTETSTNQFHSLFCPLLLVQFLITVRGINII